MNHRNTLLQEESTLLRHDHLEGDQHILQLQAPGIARRAQPGSFVHVDCGDSFTLRRPLSIMHTHPEAGTLELLYKRVGSGTTALSRREVGEQISLIGPIGTPFNLHPEQRRPLLIGGGVGMPPMIFLAQRLRNQPDYQPLVILGSELPFPFPVTPSQRLLPDLPSDVIGTQPLLESWGISCRLASLQGYPGVFNGYVTDLARIWLDNLALEERRQVEIFSCGPHPMLEAVAALAREYHLPCQVSLEEYMACGVGGCAGCVVEVQTPKGVAMKRVCVDGPVFDATTVFNE